MSSPLEQLEGTLREEAKRQKNYYLLVEEPAEAKLHSELHDAFTRLADSLTEQLK